MLPDKSLLLDSELEKLGSPRHVAAAKRLALDLGSKNAIGNTAQLAKEAKK